MGCEETPKGSCETMKFKLAKISEFKVATKLNRFLWQFATVLLHFSFLELGQLKFSLKIIKDSDSYSCACLVFSLRTFLSEFYLGFQNFKKNKAKTLAQSYRGITCK